MLIDLWADKGSIWSYEPYFKSIRTNWANQPLTTKGFTKTGKATITITGRNYSPGNGLPAGYTHFIIDVYSNNVQVGTVKLPASDNGFKSASIDVNLASGELKFVWTNDQYQPGKADANLMISCIELNQ